MMRRSGPGGGGGGGGFSKPPPAPLTHGGSGRVRLHTPEVNGTHVKDRFGCVTFIVSVVNFVMQILLTDHVLLCVYDIWFLYRKLIASSFTILLLPTLRKINDKIKKYIKELIHQISTWKISKLSEQPPSLALTPKQQREVTKPCITGSTWLLYVSLCLHTGILVFDSLGN